MKPYKQPFLDDYRKEFTEEEKRQHNRTLLEQSILEHETVLMHQQTAAKMTEQIVSAMKLKLKRWQE